MKTICLTFMIILRNQQQIDDAMDELGNDYTEDEIRLVRIKFISEMAN